ncbi:MAG: glucose-1-phosphate cytidylyltransferase [Candidatus Omnitrophica bacterium]|nr:glucose-1-phosphate cytidylyltransferase [Candidatus Omnitrophota bacterium]
MKVVILCGGKGARMEKETEYVPKPMLTVGNKPILWHIMNIYSYYGFRDFILCLGYKGEVIRDYFRNFATLNSDFTVNTKNGGFKIHDSKMPDWNVTLVDTGFDSMTGARIKRIERFIDSDVFMMTYGDAVSNIRIDNLLSFHKNHGKAATMTGVFPLYKSRFGELSEDNNSVINFTEKPVNCAALTSGGFFVLRRKIFEYLKDDTSCVFEKDALEVLVKERELAVYKHNDFWYCMDTPKDRAFLNELWDSDNAPWKYPDRKSTGWKIIFDRSY